MSYFDLILIFLAIPLLVVVYQIMPKKIRPILLLLASYGFFFYVSKWRIIFLIISSLSIYLTGLYMSKQNNLLEKELEKTKEDKKVIKEKYKKNNKRILLLTLFINIAILFAFKYLRFFTINTNHILDWLNVGYNIKLYKYAAPIGISFYTLQALSYILDVYNKKIEASKNIIEVFLYLSFFPTIMEGPITRFFEVKEYLLSGEKVHYNNFCFGYQRILYGFFKKYVIADRLNIVVKTVFDNYSNYGSFTIFFAAVAYTILLYCEFSGTMDVVIGIGEIFNIKIPENFRQPFFSKNISDFWSRWHISLGHWFKDFIFYPVSLSKPCKKINTSIRSKIKGRLGPLVVGGIALFCVWSLNGLWHGAGWTFIFYGMYHFTLILLGNIFEPIIADKCTKLKINRESKTYIVLRIVKTWFFIFIGELFFRVETLTKGFAMLKRMFSFKGLTHNELLHLGLDLKDYIILFLAIIFIFIIGILKEKNINIREKISEKHIIVRWLAYYCLIFSIIIFGAYGTGYEPVDPIYADF